MNGKTREGFYALWTLAILLCVAACVFVLIWVSLADGSGVADEFPTQEPASQDAGQTEQAAGQMEPVLPGDDMPQQSDQSQQGDTSQQQAVTAQNAVTLAETADAGQEYVDRLVFLGDSTTYGMYAYGVLPHHQVWTPASGTMSLFNWAVETIDFYTITASASQTLSIADCAATAQPEYLVITLGINGVATLDERQFKDYYTGLVKAIQQASPSTRIICQSIYPVIDSKTPDGIKNSRINAANSWILEVAEATGCHYLNTHDALTDASGGLSGDYINPEGDGIHMDTNGYNAVLQYVRTHAWL